MKNIDLDNASVKRDAKDSLGRDEFSDHLFELISCIDASAGAVVGLEGAWGSGKTTVLNGLRNYPKKPPRKFSEELTENNRPIFIEFNPWMVSGSNSLVEAMLLEFLSKLPVSVDGKEDAQNLVQHTLDFLKVLKIGKYVGPLANLVLPGSGFLVDGVVQFVADAEDAVKDLKDGVEVIKKDKKIPSLSERKKEVVKILKDWPHRFVMVLDDVDRLPPAEIASIIQAVKAVADFPNVIYVLAYDPVIMAHAIEVALNIEDGFSYLEKIIQLPVRLPRVPQNRFKSHLVERLGSVIPSDQTIHTREVEDIGKARSLVSLLLRTPRDVERLRTRLQVAIPILIKEVNVADVILLEAMDIVYPEIIRWIDGESRNLMDSGLAKYDSALTGKGYVSAPYCESEGDYEYRVRKEQEYNYNCECDWNEEVQKNGYKGSFDAYCEEMGYYGYQDVATYQEVQDKTVSMRRRLEEGWRKKVSDENGCYVVAPILEFLFPEIFVEKGQSSGSSRSNVRRVQYYRFWYKWLCYHDHNEPWSFEGIEGYVANPQKIMDDGIHLDGNDFSQLMSHVCDLYGRGLCVSNASGMLDVFLSFQGEHGSISFSEALACCIKLDVAGGLDVLRRVIRDMPVEFSRDLILELMKLEDYSCRGELDNLADYQYDLIGESFDSILKLWSDEVKKEFLKEPCKSPYRLIEWLSRFGRERFAVDLSKEFLQNKSSRLDVMFQELGLLSARNFYFREKGINRNVLPSTEYFMPLIRGSELFRDCNVSDEVITFPESILRKIIFQEIGSHSPVGDV